MKPFLTGLLLLTTFLTAEAQTIKAFADSIRIQYKIPELAFAVVSADTVFEVQFLGVQRAATGFTAKPGDRFHIGSNTKAITSFIVALLVEEGKIGWNTKFFDLFPALKRQSNKAYDDITLQDLLTFRGKLPAYTYTFSRPTRQQITGSDSEQRWQLAKYLLAQPPMRPGENGLTPSNADYILAGLMLESAAQKPFKELITDFGRAQGISFGFDYPNVSDSLQPWGHDVHVKPLPPFDHYKLNWLLAAGNINVSLPDYIKFIQLQLKGLKGQTDILPPQTFDKLLFGLPAFSFGWFNQFDPVSHHHIASNEGNAGAFITQVQIVKETGRAVIIFTNSASAATEEGIAVLLRRLKAMYGR